MSPTTGQRAGRMSTRGKVQGSHQPCQHLGTKSHGRERERDLWEVNCFQHHHIYGGHWGKKTNRDLLLLDWVTKSRCNISGKRIVCQAIFLMTYQEARCQGPFIWPCIITQRISVLACPQFFILQGLKVDFYKNHKSPHRRKLFTKDDSCPIDGCLLEIIL